MQNNITTPHGLWRYGNDFREAAFIISQSRDVERFLPYYFLLGQSIELFLKAYLMYRGYSLHELKSRKYGHDLKALAAAARKHDLKNFVPLRQTHYAAIDLLNFEYTKRRFQYQRAGLIALPDAHLIHTAANRLARGLKPLFKAEK